MSSGSPQDIETGLNQGSEAKEKDTTEVDTVSSTARDSTSHTNEQSTTADDPNVVFWDGPDDPEISTWTLLTPLASSMVAPGTREILSDFKSTDATLGSFIVSIFILGYAIGPLFIAPMSELYGRAVVYHVNNALFVIWTLACAFAPNLGALLAFRFFQGMAGVTPLTIGSGTISDLIPTEQRGKFMAIYSLGPLLGPVIGPVAGAYLVQAEGWRWVFRVLTIVSGVMTIFTYFTMSETYGMVILQRKAKRLRQETGNMKLRSKLDNGLAPRDVFLQAITRPTKMLLFSPICSLLSLYMAYVYGILYLIFVAVSPLFIREYGFSQGSSGLAFLGIGIGMLLGLGVFGATSDRIVTALAKKRGTDRKPEYRFPGLFVGAVFVPIGLLLYGWSAEYRVQYIVPILGTGFVGAGLLATFMAVGTYLVDAFTLYAASAMAANTVLRSLCGAFLPLAGPKMYAALGLGWGNTLLAGVSLLAAPMCLVFWRYGERMRTSERFKIQF